MENVNKHFSEKITWLSFVLSILVIYIHADNLKNVGLASIKTSFDYIVTTLIGGAIGGCAVPFFFMMAGYWLFRFEKDNNMFKVLFTRQKKRVKTILVPYLLWNLIGFVFYACITRIPQISVMMNSGEVIEVNILNFVKGVLFHAQYFPFWYLQDLIVLILFSPLLLCLLKSETLTVIGLCALAVSAYFMPSLKVCLTSSLFFFLLGAYLASYKRKLVEQRWSIQWIIIASMLLVVRIVLYCCEIKALNYSTKLYSPICLCIIMDAFNNYKITWFRKNSFFIYASHIIPTTIVMKVLSKFFRRDIWATVSYIITPWIVLLLIYVISLILRKYAPKLMSMLSGGRYS